MSGDTVILILFAVWLVCISVVLFLFLNFFRRLTKGVRDTDIVKVLDRILKEQGTYSQDIGELEKKVASLNEEVRGHIQKVAVVRFNPFEEVGGGHSFSLAILDARDTGVIVTGLHARERTRIYVKPVKNGKSELSLSEEEKGVLAKAQKG